MPQNAFFRRTRYLLVSQKTTQNTFFPTLHPLSTVIFATATVLAFILLRDSRFNFHCYTQREATPTQKSVRKCTATSCDILARKITKRIHSSKPASLKRPIDLPFSYYKYVKVKTMQYYKNKKITKNNMILVNTKIIIINNSYKL